MKLERSLEWLHMCIPWMVDGEWLLVKEVLLYFIIIALDNIIIHCSKS